MKPSCPTIALFALLISSAALEAQLPSIIEPKVERHEGPPLWISAGAVADAQKVIDVDRIDSIPMRRNVERQRRELGGDGPADKSNQGEKPSVAAIPISECKYTQSVADGRGGTGSTATLSDLASNSKSILRGTIRTIDLGFDSGAPGSLLGVEISETVKGSVPKPLVYILYLVARFKIGRFTSATQTRVSSLAKEMRSSCSTLRDRATGTAPSSPPEWTRFYFKPKADLSSCRLNSKTARTSRLRTAWLMSSLDWPPSGR